MTGTGTQVRDRLLMLSLIQKQVHTSPLAAESENRLFHADTPLLAAGSFLAKLSSRFGSIVESDVARNLGRWRQAFRMETEA